jgi:hypothetical protein
MANRGDDVPTPSRFCPARAQDAHDQTSESTQIAQIH